MMNISPIVNSVKCTVLGRFVQFWDDLEYSSETWKSSLRSYFKVWAVAGKNEGNRVNNPNRG